VSDQRGFTLLEVVVATAIMAIGIVSALELFSGSLHLAGDASHQSQALVLARALVDEELWRDVLEDGQRTGTEGSYAWSVATQPVERELVGRDEERGDLHDLNGDLGLWLIEAEVRWETPAGEKSVKLETARVGQIPED
jgi:general secretion pathway protein I